MLVGGFAVVDQVVAAAGGKFPSENTDRDQNTEVRHRTWIGGGCSKGEVFAITTLPSSFPKENESGSGSETISQTFGTNLDDAVSCSLIGGQDWCGDDNYYPPDFFDRAT